MMMSMKSSWSALPLVVAMAGTVFAQQPVITPETPVNSTILQQWLHSGDPRLVAWAADFARRTHDSEVVQQMPALLEHWTTLRSPAPMNLKRRSSARSSPCLTR
jgi:hypothetical protein